MRQVRMLLLLLFKRCAATLNVGVPSLIGLDNSSKNKDDNLAERDDVGRQSYQDNSWENRDDDQAERDDAGR